MSEPRPRIVLDPDHVRPAAPPRRASPKAEELRARLVKARRRTHLVMVLALVLAAGGVVAVLLDVLPGAALILVAAVLLWLCERRIARLNAIERAVDRRRVGTSTSTSTVPDGMWGWGFAAAMGMAGAWGVSSTGSDNFGGGFDGGGGGGGGFDGGGGDGGGGGP